MAQGREGDPGAMADRPVDVVPGYLRQDVLPIGCGVPASAASTSSEILVYVVVGFRAGRCSRAFVRADR